MLRKHIDLETVPAHIRNCIDPVTIALRLWNDLPIEHQHHLLEESRENYEFQQSAAGRALLELMDIDEVMVNQPSIMAHLTRTLFGRALNVQEVFDYLAAEHGMNRAQAGKLRPVEINDLLRKAIAQKAGETDQRALSADLAANQSGGNGGLALIDGGFIFADATFDLTGRPRAMLEELMSTKHRRLTANELRKRLGVDDEMVDFPEQVIKDAAGDLRNALRKAVKDSGLPSSNPLPSKGKGADLTYILKMPTPP